jgi:hypothetical protein
MSLTATRTPQGPGAPVPPAVPAPRAGFPRRRSPALVSLGVVLVVLGALGAWKYVGSAAGATHPYLAVYREVQQGAKIGPDDLQIVKITPVAGLTPVDAADVDRVVGLYAKVDLKPGTLLTIDEVTSTASPAAGQAVVGLDLKRSQRPNRTLRTGDHLTLIQLADPGAAGRPAGQLGTWQATVAGASDVFSDGSQVVDVFVTEADEAAIASLASAGDLAVALVSGG